MAILLYEILSFVSRTAGPGQKAFDLMALNPDKAADANTFQSSRHDQTTDGLLGNVEVKGGFIDPQKPALTGRKLFGAHAAAGARNVVLSPRKNVVV